MSTLTSYAFSSQVDDNIIMRAGTMFLVSSGTLLRGKDVRGLRDAQIMLHEMPSVGPAPCHTIAFVLTTGKTIHSMAHDENNVGFLRFKNRDMCPVRALASYKVYMEDIAVSVK